MSHRPNFAAKRFFYFLGCPVGCPARRVNNDGGGGGTGWGKQAIEQFGLGGQYSEPRPVERVRRSDDAVDREIPLLICLCNFLCYNVSPLILLPRPPHAACLAGRSMGLRPVACFAPRQLEPVQPSRLPSSRSQAVSPPEGQFWSWSKLSADGRW